VGVGGGWRHPELKEVTEYSEEARAAADGWVRVLQRQVAGVRVCCEGGFG
jgi:hypothetical protein